jgi:hypothetical protein
MRAALILLFSIFSFPFIYSQKALDYWQAARSGDADAQLNLALCYYAGEGGVPKDGNTALYWLEKALSGKNQNCPAAEILIRNLETQGFSSSRARLSLPSPMAQRPTPSFNPYSVPQQAARATGKRFINWMVPLIEHNIMADGKKGMNIHASFTVGNMINRNMKCSAFFRIKDGPILTSTNKNFQSSRGELVVSTDIVPDTQNASYEDVVLFIPYDEFDLVPGKRHDLVCGVALFGQSTKTNKWECYISSDMNFWLKK